MLEFIRHYFLPQHTNNHRAKLIQNFSIFFLVIGLVWVISASLVVKKTHPEVLGISYSISDSEMLSLVNAQRAQKGLPPLVMNSELSQAAAGKASNMFTNNYWAHFGPDGATPWQFIRGAGYDYLDAGENLAKGFTNSNDVVNAWMNSESHKANILSPKYHDIGFAVVEGNLEGEDTVLVVQMFGSRGEVAKAPEETEVAVQTVPETIQVATPESQLIKVVESPTPTPVLLAQEPLVLNSNSNIELNPALDIKSFSKSFLLIIFAVLLVVFILDLLIIERRKIPRVVGHNLDHIILISLFILFILIFRAEFIL